MDLQDSWQKRNSSNDAGGLLCPGNDNIAGSLNKLVIRRCCVSKALAEEEAEEASEDAEAQVEGKSYSKAEGTVAVPSGISMGLIKLTSKEGGNEKSACTGGNANQGEIRAKVFLAKCCQNDIREDAIDSPIAYSHENTPYPEVATVRSD